ncbi:MAG: hypothetical protein O3C34_15580 [Proteobacteria bacterium]|nr:hypothetical protein [Pseudomonadota bacterium]
MARGKYLSLEEARKAGNLKQFAKEHPSQADERIWPLMRAVTGSPKAGGTSDRDVSEDCTGTQIPPDTSEDA